jgi:heat shock protein HslJ
MRTSIRRHAPVLTCVLVLGACRYTAMTDAAATPSLDGTAWILASLPGRTLTERARPTLQFTGDRLAGSDGCNRYSGRFESGAGKFKVLPGVAATQMACVPEVDEQARAFMQALLGAADLRMTGDELSLLDAEGKALATFSAQSQRLAGTSWRATGINDGKGGVVSVLAGTHVTLEFGDDGQQATGWSGCNRYTSRVTTNDTALGFESPAATRKACPQPGVMEQERTFLDALASVATSRLEGDRLELRRADGAIALVLYRAGTE